MRLPKNNTCHWNVPRRTLHYPHSRSIPPTLNLWIAPQNSARIARGWGRWEFSTFPSPSSSNRDLHLYGGQPHPPTKPFQPSAPSRRSSWWDPSRVLTFYPHLPLKVQPLDYAWLDCYSVLVWRWWWCSGTVVVFVVEEGAKWRDSKLVRYTMNQFGSIHLYCGQCGEKN